MTAAPARSAARWRGAAAGLLTGALVLAAHGAAGGALPPGPSSLQVVVLAAVIGALVTGLPRAGALGSLIVVLTVGQVAGHLLLAAAGHVHGHPAGAGSAMAAAHAVAVLLGAVLIRAGERLCLVLSTTIALTGHDAVLPTPPAPLQSRPASRTPLPVMPALVSSLSHRGPPER